MVRRCEARPGEAVKATQVEASHGLAWHSMAVMVRRGVDGAVCLVWETWSVLWQSRQVVEG